MQNTVEKLAQAGEDLRLRLLRIAIDEDGAVKKAAQQTER